MYQGASGEDGAIVTGNDSRDGESGGQASLGGVPPSFGASSSPPPAAPPDVPVPEAPVPEAPAAQTPVPEIPVPETPVPETPVPETPAAQAPAFPPESGSLLPAAGPEAEPTVGWYPSSPVGPPTAGPFAAPSIPARRAGRPLAWRNSRSRLANALLFGIGPLVLAGVVVAAFLLVSPGKGSASSLGFQVGPAATAASAGVPAASPSPSPSSPAAHGKHHARATPSSTVAKVPAISTAKPKATPKPAHKSGGGGITPHNLGLPDFAGYCHHIGDRTAELIASNAYGWRCTLNTAHVLLVTDVCAWTYHLSAGQVVSVSTNYGDPSAWQCWRINRNLGVLNVTSYCAAAGLGTSELVTYNAYGWYCTSPAAPVNTTVGCDTVYHVNDAVARFAVFADPYSWQCWD
jgi:hypothetical protein